MIASDTVWWFEGRGYAAYSTVQAIRRIQAGETWPSDAVYELPDGGWRIDSDKSGVHPILGLYYLLMATAFAGYIPPPTPPIPPPPAPTPPAPTPPAPSGVWDTVVSWVTEQIANVTTTINKLIASSQEWIANEATNIKQFASDTYTNIKGQTDNVLKNATQFVNDAVNTAKDWLNEKTTELLTNATIAYDTIRDELDSKISTASLQLQEIKDTATDAVSEGIANLHNLVSEAKQTIQDEIEIRLKTIRDFMDSAFANLGDRFNDILQEFASSFWDKLAEVL